MDEQGDTQQGFHIQPVDPRWGTDEDTCLHIALVQPEIPGNTGNIGRLCAGTNVWLHLVKPLGFELSNRYLKRAGLDYWPHVNLCVHESFDALMAIFPKERLYFFSTHASHRYTDVVYTPGSVLLFGRETKGFDQHIHEDYTERFVLIPRTEKVRSLNLSNACAIATYEAMRQLEWTPMFGTKQ